MNSILQRYEHFATWTKNIFILLIFCCLHNDYHRILQSGKHILASHNEQKIVQSKVRRFFVVFAANTNLAKSCNFTLKNLAKSCKFAQKKMRIEYVTASVYVSFLLTVKQCANCLLNNHPFICTAKPSSMRGLRRVRISSGVTFCRFWAGVGRSMV